MKSSVLILLGIVAVLLVGGAFALTFMHDIANVADGGEYGTFNKVADKVDQVTSSVKVTTWNKQRIYIIKLNINNSLYKTNLSCFFII